MGLQVALEYSKKYTSDLCRVCTLDKNRGKGGAIRMGVMKSRGKLILFADADGASKFSDCEKLESAIKKTSDDFEVSIFILISCLFITLLKFSIYFCRKRTLSRVGPEDTWRKSLWPR